MCTWGGGIGFRGLMSRGLEIKEKDIGKKPCLSRATYPLSTLLFSNSKLNVVTYLLNGGEKTSCSLGMRSRGDAFIIFNSYKIEK